MNKRRRFKAKRRRTEFRAVHKAMNAPSYLSRLARIDKLMEATGEPEQHELNQLTDEVLAYEETWFVKDRGLLQRLRAFGRRTFSQRKPLGQPESDVHNGTI